VGGTQKSGLARIVLVERFFDKFVPFPRKVLNSLFSDVLVLINLINLSASIVFQEEAFTSLGRYAIVEVTRVWAAGMGQYIVVVVASEQSCPGRVVASVDSRVSWGTGISPWSSSFRLVTVVSAFCDIRQLAADRL
jgi:hypothetical protein